MIAGAAPAFLGLQHTCEATKPVTLQGPFILEKNAAPKIRVTILGFLKIRMIIFEGLYKGPLLGEQLPCVHG